jgi:hypothetical protein
MGDPIMQNSIQDVSKRTGALGMKGVHEVLAFIIDSQKEDPGETQKKDETI